MRYSKTVPVKIIVIGAGGTGGYVIPHLYRLAMAARRQIRILVCDGDVVEQKNLIRQNFVEQDIGRNKAQVLAERYSAAFGIECEYVPGFIESEEELLRLTNPDFYARPYSGVPEGQRVILLGCVDNNRSRRLCHEIFCKQENLIYLDSGNGEHTGQVVCGVRQNGRTTYKPVGSRYPDVLKKEDKFPSELSCAERAVSAPQSVTANLTAATAVVSFLYDLLFVGELKTRAVTFSSKQIQMRAEITKKRKKAKKPCKKET
ncbi:MAG: ThiF family adenylyltransferase [Clostridia bacterium]|nr:ThiF family adenylyltransferase [Clostridia bacterium]